MLLGWRIRKLGILKFLWCFTVLSTDQSLSKPTDVARNDSKVNETPSACDQTTQTEDVQGFFKKPSEEDNAWQGTITIQE